jgi:hypothetical protein
MEAVESWKWMVDGEEEDEEKQEMDLWSFYQLSANHHQPLLTTATGSRG